MPSVSMLSHRCSQVTCTKRVCINSILIPTLERAPVVTHSPRPSDSNRQVSPTPTDRHQARKLAVLSLAKKEPEGALRRQGILLDGSVCWRPDDGTEGDTYWCDVIERVWLFWDHFTFTHRRWPVNPPRKQPARQEQSG